MVIVLDTSAWVDHLQRAGTRAAAEVRQLLQADLPEVVTCDPVVMEIRAGARSPQEARAIEPITDGLRELSTRTEDFRTAAEIYRQLRWTGTTVRSQLDCLIAAIVVRHRVTLWHKDADFVAIATVVPLDHVDLR